MALGELYSKTSSTSILKTSNINSIYAGLIIHGHSQQRNVKVLGRIISTKC